MIDHAICTAEGHGPQVSPLPKLHHHGPHGERVAHARWGNLGGDTECVGCRAGYSRRSVTGSSHPKHSPPSNTWPPATEL